MSTTLAPYRTPVNDRIGRRARSARRLLRTASLFVTLMVLPFVALLRGSTWIYLSGRGSAWSALVGGALLALAAVTLLGVWISKRLTGRARIRFVAQWFAIPLVVVFVGQALVFLSAANAKTDAVRSCYTSLHPLLRLSVATLVLADGDLVVTDMAREPEDYRRMGIPEVNWSMHYRQRDGWVHAVDLRTIGRSRVRNLMTGLYFRVLGFRVLRHDVTADHLHVSLPVAGERSGATRRTR